MNIDYGLFILLGLMVYRLSFMVAREEGPFEIFSFWRGHINPSQSNWIGRGVNCPICISFWLSLFVALLFYREFVILKWFGLAGLATLFERVSN